MRGDSRAAGRAGRQGDWSDRSWELDHIGGIPSASAFAPHPFGHRLSFASAAFQCFSHPPTPGPCRLDRGSCLALR